eukprot:12045015-Prorocentrum_lima.AAC.1
MLRDRLESSQLRAAGGSHAKSSGCRWWQLSVHLGTKPGALGLAENLAAADAKAAKADAAR